MIIFEKFCWPTYWKLINGILSNRMWYLMDFRQQALRRDSIAAEKDQYNSLSSFNNAEHVNWLGKLWTRKRCCFESKCFHLVALSVFVYANLGRFVSKLLSMSYFNTFFVFRHSKPGRWGPGVSLIVTSMFCLLINFSFLPIST